MNKNACVCFCVCVSVMSFVFVCDIFTFNGVPKKVGQDED